MGKSYIEEVVAEIGISEDWFKVYNREADLAFMMNEVKEHAEEDGIKIGEERGEARGIKIGEERGKASGIKENQKKTALKMIKDGLNLDIIKKYTGLSKSAIKTLM